MFHMRQGSWGEKVSSRFVFVCAVDARVLRDLKWSASFQGGRKSLARSQIRVQVKMFFPLDP